MNLQQKKAIEFIEKPLLIIAGPGTGKTWVIAEKIKYLISQKIAKPEEILALTFTEKAALEMEERVDQIIPYGFFQMTITTFHSFANQLLKEEASSIGLSSDFKLMTAAENIIFLKKNLFLFDLKYYRPITTPEKFLEDLLNHFFRLQDENISPQEYLLWAEKKIKSKKKKNRQENLELEKYLELAKAYQTYQNLKIKEQLMDFGDLIYYLIQLFKKRPNILKNYQEKYRFILIDEFQDTNIAQYELIKLLAPAKKNPKLTVVGDDSQSIYKFRGASVSNILNFIKDYPQTKIISLTVNYRSNQIILDCAYQLIKNNNPDTLEAKLGISKKLIAQKKLIQNSPIKFLLANNADEEADLVAQEILKLKNEYQYNQIAILTRANNHADIFAKTLAYYGIPYQFLGAGILYKQPEIKDLIAYLKVLYNPEDSISLYRVLSMDIFNLNLKDLALLLSMSKKTNLSLFETIEVYLSFFDQNLYREEFLIYKSHLPLLKKETQLTLLKIYQMINKHLKRVKKDSAGQILYYLLEDSGYLSKLVNYKTLKDEKIALNISKFFTKLKNYEMEHEDASVFAIVDYLEMSLRLKESPLAETTDINLSNAVNILTIHSAKGLEFPVVFLVNLTKGRFPTYKRNEAIPIPQELIKEILPQGDYHEQEERRLFYVGLTRAMNKLYLTASRFYGEGKRQQNISPFVIEALGEETAKKLLSKKNEEKKQLNLFDFYKPKKEIITKDSFDVKNYSYSQLETFQLCPLKYKYQYLLKIPTPPQSQTSFGESIHKTLYYFYKGFSKNKNINKKDLFKILDNQWLPIGYSSKMHQKRMKKEAKKILSLYFDNFHHQNIKIQALEKNFKIKIDNKNFIVGKIDRIDKINNNKFEIIDYKTGKIPKEKEIEENLQLLIYALALKENLFPKTRLNNIILTFYYLSENKKVSKSINQEKIKKLKKIIKSNILQIKKGDFNPQVGPWCDFCPFIILCPAWQ